MSQAADSEVVYVILCTCHNQGPYLNSLFHFFVVNTYMGMFMYYHPFSAITNFFASRNTFFRFKKKVFTVIRIKKDFKVM